MVKHCKAHPVEVIHKRFPDGEQYLRIVSDVKDQDVIIVQSLYPDQDSKLIEIYLALEALEGVGSTNTKIAIPYMAYARQDKRFLPGEPISVKALYTPLSLFNVSKIVALDLHSPKIAENLGLNISNIIPHAYIASKAGIRVDFVLAPDKGALHRAQLVAEALGTPYSYLEKFRDRVTGEITVSSRELDVKGASVAIVDDIVSTGGTLAKATQFLYKLGAQKVYAIITHALFSEKALQILSSSGLDLLITTNSINHPVTLPHWVQVVDVAELLCAELIK